VDKTSLKTMARIRDLVEVGDYDDVDDWPTPFD